MYNHLHESYNLIGLMVIFLDESRMINSVQDNGIISIVILIFKNLEFRLCCILSHLYIGINEEMDYRILK
jgi:hypothetical protein